MKKIVHADLKGVNVLITPSGRACICDFGLARIADSQLVGLSSSISRAAGTLRWMAPELLAENVIATKESDIYAFACVCYEILTSLPPFHKCKNDGAVIIQVSLGKRPSRPETLPKLLDVVWSMMELCWQADPSLRPSAPTILRGLKPTVGTPIDPALLTLHSPPNPDILQSSSTPKPTLRPSASTILHDHDVAVAKPAITSLVREQSVLAEPYQSNSQGDLSSHRSAATSRAARHQSPSPQRGILLPASPYHPPHSSPPHSPESLTPWLATSISESSSRTSPPPPSPSDLVSATSSDSDDLGDGHWQKLPTHMANRRYLKSSPARLTAFKWVRGELIGKGTFGRVYLALNTTTGEMMAVKQVALPQTWNDRSRAVVGVSSLESETLTDLDHPNIVQYLGFEETPTNLNTFLEYVPGGSVGSILLKHGKLSEPVTISFSAQILTGLEYLHSKGILHRDLKASNILVGMDGVCKISNFRQSKRTTKHRRAHTAMRGSSFWMAPEVLSPPKNGYDCKVDIWSLGCMILEMLTGTRPWSGVTNIPVMIMVSRDRTPPPVPEGVVLSELADDFLRRKCFAGDPDERPTAVELRRHKYLELPPDWKFSGFP
ncbi:mitogen-activated protein kinase kinase kinase [Marasmius tenuissimus]|nr:mitogen-activated protein kinase kinase kinase [Marasmius tenuissimus]